MSTGFWNISKKFNILLGIFREKFTEGKIHWSLKIRSLKAHIKNLCYVFCKRLLKVHDRNVFTTYCTFCFMLHALVSGSQFWVAQKTAPSACIIKVTPPPWSYVPKVIEFLLASRVQLCTATELKIIMQNYFPENETAFSFYVHIRVH